jgi:hypothetical protein
MEGYLEVAEGIWYEVKTGLPWTTRKQVPNGRGCSVRTDGELIRINVKNSYGYYLATIGGKKPMFHRLVYEHFNGPIPDVMEVDHINRVRDDNRIENLRLANRSQNMMNKTKYKNNRSGYKGVRKNTRGYRATINAYKVRHYLGTYDTPEEASAAYELAAEQLFGDFNVRKRSA